MNTYTLLLEYIKDTAEQDEYISTITQGEFDKHFDESKNTVYPLLHIQINSANFTNGNLIEFDVQIGCFSQRDEVINDNDSKFYRNDNEVDNYNETLMSLNRIFLKMARDFENIGVLMDDNPTCEKYENHSSQLLDGWIMDTTIKVPNDLINICQ